MNANKRARILGYWISGIPLSVVFLLAGAGCVDMMLRLPRDQFWLLIFVSVFCLCCFVGVTLVEGNPSWKDRD